MITGGIPFAKGQGRGLGSMVFGQAAGAQCAVGGVAAAGKGLGANFKGGYTEEDRSRDWFCDTCRERNFQRRTECIKCSSQRPADGGKAPAKLEVGMTLTGMVKSYNKKGFGFLMVLDSDIGQDLYYTREELSPKLELRNIPGQNVTFDIGRQVPGGKLIAVSIRPVGEPKEDPAVLRRAAMMGNGPGYGRGGTGGLGGHGGYGAHGGHVGGPGLHGGGGHGGGYGGGCGGGCPYMPQAGGFSDGDAHGGYGGRPMGMVPQGQRRNISPHAGSRAYKESLMEGLKKRQAERDAAKGSRSKSQARRKRKGSSSSGSSSAPGRRKKRDSSSSSSGGKRKKRRKTARSSSSSSSSGEVEIQGEAAAAKSNTTSSSSGNPDIEKAKAEALEEMLKLRDIQPKEKRLSDWRALLRKWHPDKNPERTEVATAVFQFLQKGKSMLEA